MTSKIRKIGQTFIPAQKLEYAKLMVEENYTNQQVMDLSGAGSTAVSRWKRQFQAEQQGQVVEGKVALDVDRSLKSEYLNGLTFINHPSVVSAVEYYIRYYNNKRLHSAIANITPVQKKQALQNVA